MHVDALPNTRSMQAALPVLRDKIDQLSARVDSKIETLAEKTNARIEAVQTALTGQIKDTNAGFYAVGAWYEDFSQTTDEEVKQLLREASSRRMMGAAASDS